MKQKKCNSKIFMTIFLALAFVLQSFSVGSLQSGAMIRAHKSFAKGDYEKALNRLSLSTMLTLQKYFIKMHRFT
jgi:hypothetical protein